MSDISNAASDAAGKAPLAYVGDYSYVPGGITTQQYALFGLMMEAVGIGCPNFIMPDLLVFDQGHNHAFLVPPDRLRYWSEYFDLESLQAFMTSVGVTPLDGPKIAGKFGWSFYQKGLAAIQRPEIEGILTPDHVVCRFVRAMVPLLRSSKLLTELKRRVFDEHGVTVVLQCRIEADWKRLVQAEWRADKRAHLDVADIVSRVARTCNVNRLLICCDEKYLPVSKTEISEELLKQTGVTALFKSDFLDPATRETYNPLDLSLIDFELAVSAPTFVGLTSSNFSSAIALTRFALRRTRDSSDFVYDVPGPGIAARSDGGVYHQSEVAAKEYFAERRNAFWLAQTWVVESGDKARALQLYRKRLELQDNGTEEHYVSAYRVGQILSETGATDHEVIEAFETAIRSKPDRADAYHGLSRHLRIKERFAEGFEAAKPALDFLPKPGALLGAPWIYEYGLMDEYAVNAYWSGHFGECVEACEKLLSCPSLPENYRPRIELNATLARERMPLAPDLFGLRTQDDPVRILVRRKGALGDVILLTPALARLRYMLGPSAKICVETDYPDVLKDSTVVDEGRPLGSYDATAFTRVIDLDWGYERHIKVPAVDGYMLAMFGDSEWPTKQTFLAREPFYELPALRWERSVVVHAARTHQLRTFPDRFWIEVQQGLVGSGFDCLVVGSDRDFCIPLSNGITDLRGKTSLQQLAWIIDRAACYLGSDSGVMHVAGTTLTPVVALFTTVPPALRLPWRQGQFAWQTIALLPTLDCVGCGVTQSWPHLVVTCKRGDRACLNEQAVSPKAVLEAASRIIAAA